MQAPRDVNRRIADALEAVGRALEVPTWPAVEVRWNRRLRRAGRALIEGRGSRFLRATIELSPVYFEVYPADLYGILVHEAAHVGLAIRGLPFGHTPTFRRVVERAGGLQHGKALPGRVFRYRCPVCELTFERRRRTTGDRWCAACVDRTDGQLGIDPYTPDRCLRLIGTGFSGLDSR